MASGGDSGRREASVVLDAAGQWFADEGRILERGLLVRPGVLEAEANPIAQTVSVRYDPAAHVARAAARLDRGVRVPLRRRVGPAITSVPGAADSLAGACGTAARGA